MGTSIEIGGKENKYSDFKPKTRLSRIHSLIFSVFFNLYFTATGKTNCLDRILVGVRILEFLTQLEKCTR